jgi:hypothetical protein
MNPSLDNPLSEFAGTSEVSVHADAESQPKRMKLGFDLLKKAGYSGIGGLGKQETGIAEPVSVVVAPESVGLGYLNDEELEENDTSALMPVEGAPDEAEAVVIRIVHPNVRDEEVLSLASRWGGVRRYLRKEGMFVMMLAVPANAREMVARYKRQGLKLGGLEVQCFLANAALIDDPLAVEVGRAIVPSSPVRNEGAPLDGMSLLLQTLGARISLPSLLIKKDEENEEEEQRNNMQESDVGVVSSKPTATSTFLQQLKPKTDLAPLLSSLNKLLDKQKVQEHEQEEEPFKEDLIVSVISDFDADSDSQVSVRTGDKVVLRYRDDSSGWSEIEFGNQIGWVPSSYLQ